MKSYDEIDHENEQVDWKWFVIDMVIMISFSVAFAWVFIYGIPALALLFAV